jgi:hypothetical protein
MGLGKRRLMQRRETAIAGLLTTLLFVGALVDDVFGNVPADDAPGAKLSASIANPDWATLLSTFFWGLACIAMIWFLAGLRGQIASASEGLANVAFGAGIAAVALLAITPAPDLGGWVWSDQANRDLEPAAAEALKAIANGFYFTAALVLAGVYLAVGLVSIRHQLFPRWFGGISLLLALVATIPMVGVATLLIGFPLWTIIISVMLWRANRDGPPVGYLQPRVRG